MIQKLTLTATLLALLMPAAGSSPQGPEAQINTYPDGFFYSGGRSYLGVEVKDITPDRVGALKLKEERGVEIASLDQDAPAGKAGLKEHDVVLEYNGTRVESAEQFQRMIRETPPGRSVALGISRDGNFMNITAQIGDRAKLTSKAFRIERNGPEIFIPELPDTREFNWTFNAGGLAFAPPLGIQADNLTQQLGDFFGVKNAEGILVKAVEKGSPAEKAGMKAGDVITRADNEKISDRSDLRRILRSHRNGGKVALGIVRDKHEQTLTIDLPERKPGDSSGIEILMPDVETIDDLQSTLRDLQPQISDAVRKQMSQLKPQLMQERKALQAIKPELEKNMAQWQKEFRKAAKEWQIEFHDFI